MGILVGKAGIPDQAVVVAGGIQGIIDKAVIALIFRGNAPLDRSRSGHRYRVEDEDAGHGIGAVHQRGGAFQDLDGMDAGSVDLDAVLIPPLLAFLADAVVHDDHPVVSQAADDRLGDGAAGGDLGHAGLPGDGADDVGRGPRLQIDGLDDRNGDRDFVQMDVAGKARDDQCIQLQVVVEYVRGIRYLLSVHHHAYAQ